MVFRFLFIDSSLVLGECLIALRFSRTRDCPGPEPVPSATCAEVVLMLLSADLSLDCND